MGLWQQSPAASAERLSKFSTFIKICVYLILNADKDAGMVHSGASNMFLFLRQLLKNRPCTMSPYLLLGAPLNLPCSFKLFSYHAWQQCIFYAWHSIKHMLTVNTTVLAITLRKFIPKHLINPERVETTLAGDQGKNPGKYLVFVSSLVMETSMGLKQRSRMIEKDHAIEQMCECRGNMLLCSAGCLAEEVMISLFWVFE